MHFHMPDHVAAELPLRAGDDAAAVRWMALSEESPDYRALYASHKAIVDMVLQTHPASGLATTSDVGVPAFTPAFTAARCRRVDDDGRGRLHHQEAKVIGRG